MRTDPDRPSLSGQQGPNRVLRPFEGEESRHGRGHRGGLSSKSNRENILISLESVSPRRLRAEATARLEIYAKAEIARPTCRNRGFRDVEVWSRAWDITRSGLIKRELIPRRMCDYCICRARAILSIPLFLECRGVTFHALGSPEPNSFTVTGHQHRSPEQFSTSHCTSAGLA